MKQFAPRLLIRAVLFRFTQPLFCAVWIVLTIVYGWMAVDAAQSAHATLPRAGFRIPTNHNVQIGNIRFQEVINGLAEKYDQTAVELEKGLRRSAHTNFVLNLTATLLCLVGLSAQLLSGLRALLGDEVDSEPVNRARTRRIRAQVPIDFSEGPMGIPETIPLHDGSFPDAGYGR